jgi:hypothetical protein
MSKHTPGPWKIGNEHNYQADRYAKNSEWAHIRDKNGGLIAKVESVNPKGKRKSCDFDIEAANARLICACPDMLEALKGLFEHCAMVHKHWGDGDNTKEANTAIKKAEAAIKKAEGN